MPSKSENFTVKTGEGSEVKTAEGSVMLYSDAELDRLEAAGLEKPHRVLLNQIVKIRAMDAVRQTLVAKSPMAQLTAKLKADPELLKKIKALAGLE